jgi:hypothetical protein
MTLLTQFFFVKCNQEHYFLCREGRVHAGPYSMLVFGSHRVLMILDENNYERLKAHQLRTTPVTEEELATVASVLQLDGYDDVQLNKN